jgi:hypothetical protein
MQSTNHGVKEISGVSLPLCFSGSQMPTMVSANIEQEDVPDGDEHDNDEENDSIMDNDSVNEDASYDDGDK